MNRAEWRVFRISNEKEVSLYFELRGACDFSLGSEGSHNFHRLLREKEKRGDEMLVIDLRQIDNSEMGDGDIEGLTKCLSNYLSFRANEQYVCFVVSNNNNHRDRINRVARFSKQSGILLGDIKIFAISSDTAKIDLEREKEKIRKWSKEINCFLTERKEVPQSEQWDKSTSAGTNENLVPFSKKRRMRGR